MRAYKLTDEKMQTHNGCQWTPGEWNETSGEGELCGPGWLHFYESPELAALMNPIHANFKLPLCWEADVEGEFKFDSCLKFGATRGQIVERAELPQYSMTQRVAFGILCAYPFGSDSWRTWADKWLSGEDRAEAAAMAEAEARAEAAAEAAVWVAAEADMALYILLCAEAAKDF